MLESIGVPETPEPASMSWAIHGVRLSMRISAAERAPRGGDWCEAFAVSDHVMALSIGDVCGHGEAKFAAMVATRQAIRDAALRGFDPGQTLVAGHRCLRSYDVDEYATALFGLLNLRDRTLVFANAGHPPPLMANPREATYLEYVDSDLPLGIEELFSPTLREIDVPAATLLVFYTDGVTEHKRRPVEGAGELREAAMFATNFSLMGTASVIEKQMLLTGSNRDDAAILTAWTPPALAPTRTFARPFERAG
jgi:serine phosphatase RsbU (regulator of sigma subunit)